jgi:hypothetical protein
VVYQSTPTEVKVRLGFPEPEYVERGYPVIAANLVGITPAPVREDIEPETYGRVGVDAYLKHLPDAYDFAWQVDCFSRFHSHLDQMSEHVLTQMGSRNRPGYVEIATATLSSDVSEGEFIVLDRTTSVRKRTGTTLQAFRILSVGSSNVLTVEEEASFDFSVSETVCYKARFETIFDNSFFDYEQDAGGHPYYRRIHNYTVWGCLDLDTAEMVKVTTVAPEMTTSPYWDEVTYGSEGLRKYKT